MRRYFVEKDGFEDKFYLIEEDGDFYDHGDQDLLIATFKDRVRADEVCELLNEKHQ